MSDQIAVDRVTHEAPVAAYEEMPLTIAEGGPGRFINREAFCLITYRCDNPKFATREIRVWNSRDGRIAEWYRHTVDGEQYMRVPGSEVYRPNHIPELNSFVIDDADDKGTPRVQLATMQWLEQFKKRYANPNKTIKRLEGLIEAGKHELSKQAGKHAAQVTEMAEQIQKLKDTITRLSNQELVAQQALRATGAALADRDDQIAALNQVCERAGRYESLALEYADKVMRLGGPASYAVVPLLRLQ